MNHDRSSDIAVIGAGVTGLSIAYQLARRGANVVVYERQRIAAEASGVQPGGVRQQWGTDINCRMGREAVHFYQQFNETLDTPITASLQSCGYVFVAETPARLEQLRKNVAVQKSHGIPAELLTPEELAEVVPDLQVESLVGGSFCPEDGYVDRPQAAVEAFADAAGRLGAGIRYAEVRQLTRVGDSWRLDLADASTAWASEVVVAGGYFTPDLVGPLGLELPIRKEPRYLFYSRPIRERLLEPLVVALDRHFAAKQLADGRVLASDLSAAEGDGAGQTVWKRRVREHIDALLPRLEPVTFPLLIEGFYDMTPDGQAIVGPVSGLDGLWLAAGFSGHGFMMAPVVGRVIAEGMVDGRHAEEFDIFSAERFRREDLVSEPQAF